MPTVFEIGSIKVKVYGDDHNPPHAHAKIGDGAQYEARIEIKTGKVLNNKGFKAGDLSVLVARILARKDDLLQAWSDLNGE